MLKAKLLILIVFLLMPTNLLAKPYRGFREGPYMRIIGGMAYQTYDNIKRNNIQNGNNHDGTYGFEFGWNLWDATAAELEVRYITARIRDNREHIVNVNLNIKYSFVTDALTNIGSLHILPFVKGGPTGVVSGIPGDPAVNNKLMTVWGLGFSGSTGIDFLFMKYISLGIYGQIDLYYLSQAHQTINNVSELIIAGGWEPQISVLAAAGVHF